MFEISLLNYIIIFCRIFDSACYAVYVMSVMERILVPILLIELSSKKSFLRINITIFFVGNLSYKFNLKYFAVKVTVNEIFTKIFFQ